jgi:hypothetical protein
MDSSLSETDKVADRRPFRLFTTEGTEPTDVHSTRIPRIHTDFKLTTENREPATAVFSHEGREEYGEFN